ncbi:hypothetical protein [Halomonas sp. Mc5H-6]|uniref:hypothetical protein n=1 Tax=Halomonas sp. Mc5H-6 TaxID=2954500 RepID=UPI0020984BD4|nr:hypothetical protein [Halomonas sp. Mc5H-6]MCO7245262.1 hypothetical protein [Halomonas sp. Mc5H-6]
MADSGDKIQQLQEMRSDAEREAVEKRFRGGDNGGNDGGEPPMSNLEHRVGKLESDAGDIKVTLARMEGKFDTMDAKLNNFVTWKSAFAGLTVITLGLLAAIGTTIGAAWWMAQQYLAPLLQAAGAS